MNAREHIAAAEYELEQAKGLDWSVTQNQEEAALWIASAHSHAHIANAMLCLPADPPVEPVPEDAAATASASVEVPTTE